jgi:UV damage endonuclease UvdE
MTPPDHPLRLGFPVKVIGKPGLKSNDTRRWQKHPHLKCSLEHVTEILHYLHKERLDMYRLSSDLAPYATHPDMPQFHNMVAESDAELRAFGALARDYGIRLSFHPSQYVLLNSPDPALTRKSIWDFASQAEMLDRMDCDEEAVMVTHVGGVYDDHEASRARWIEGWEQCPDFVKQRLVLENDDIRFSAADVLWIHERTGVRLIFDYQHFWCLNPERLDIRETLERFLATWPEGVRPKIHFSSPRTEGARQGDRAGQDRAAAADLDRPFGLHQPVRVRDLHAHGRGPELRRDDGGQVEGHIDPEAPPRPAPLRARCRRPLRDRRGRVRGRSRAGTRRQRRFGTGYRRGSAHAGAGSRRVERALTSQTSLGEGGQT